MARTKRLFSTLQRRGPHRVLRGDLGFAGLPGIVYTPESGFKLPAVAFAHDWITPAQAYSETLAHLASWGIVAAAPNTERSVAPSVLNFSFDLGRTLDIVTGVRLGSGEISVHPGKLAVVGHGFGGAAAIFTAAGMNDRLKTAAAIFPAVSNPPVTQPAAGLKVPGVIFAAPGDDLAIRSGSLQLNQSWADGTLRLVSKAEPRGLAERRRLAGLVGLGGSDRRTQKAVRALLTGYLLYTLTGDKTYRDFADPEVILPGTEAVSDDLVRATPEERVAALLKG